MSIFPWHDLRQTSEGQSKGRAQIDSKGSNILCQKNPKWAGLYPHSGLPDLNSWQRSLITGTTNPKTSDTFKNEWIHKQTQMDRETDGLIEFLCSCLSLKNQSKNLQEYFFSFGLTRFKQIMKFLLFTTFETPGKSDVWRTDKSRETLSICLKISCHLTFQSKFLLSSGDWLLMLKVTSSRDGEYLKFSEYIRWFLFQERINVFRKYPRGIAGHIQSNLCSRSEKANKTIWRAEIWIAMNDLSMIIKSSGTLSLEIHFHF